MQSSGSMTCSSCTLPLMQCTGHFLAHMVQPMQSSAMKNAMFYPLQGLLPPTCQPACSAWEPPSVPAAPAAKEENPLFTRLPPHFGQVTLVDFERTRASKASSHPSHVYS